MASPDKDGKKEAAVKAAGAAVVAGVVWSIISILKGKKEKVKERGSSIILDDGDNEEEINNDISPTNYAEGDDYYNEKVIKDSVEKIKDSVEKIKEGGSIDVGVVYVEQEVIAILDVAKKLEVFTLLHSFPCLTLDLIYIFVHAFIHYTFATLFYVERESSVLNA